MTSTELGDRYPGIDRPGGLAAAIEREALRAGVDVGAVVTTPGGTAGLTSARGGIGVFLQTTTGEFRIAMAGDGHPWAAGFSGDLAQVVGAAGAWREGATLAQLRARFPFMEYPPVAQAYEDGDPVGFFWRTFLADPDLTALHGFLVAAQADDRLRALMPMVSHLTLLRLLFDHRDPATGLVFVVARPDGSFEVGSSATGETATLAGSVAEAVSIAGALAGAATA